MKKLLFLTILLTLPIWCQALEYKWTAYTTVQEAIPYTYQTTISHITTISIQSTVSGYTILNGTTTTESEYNPKISDFTIIDTGNISAPSRWSTNTGILDQTSNIYSNPIASKPIDKEGTMAVLSLSSAQFISFNAISYDDDAFGFGYFKDTANMIRFSLNKQFNYWRLDRKLNGTWIPQVDQNSTYNIGQWYNLAWRTTEYPNGFEIAIDGTPFIQSADSSYIGWKPFFYCWGNTPTYFKDIKWGYTQATTFQRPYSYETTISQNSTWSETSTIQAIRYEPLNLYRLDIQ